MNQVGDEAACVNQELVKQLYGSSTLTLLASQAVALAAASVIYGHVSILSWYLWIGLFSFITLIRLALTYAWRRQTDVPASELSQWTRKYMLGAFAAGLSWSSIAFLDSASMPLYHQLFLMIILVGMPVASMPTNAIYLPIYYAFSVPPLARVYYWSLFEVEDLGMHFFWVAIVYTVMLLVTVHRYYGNLRKKIEMDLKNNQLIKDLSLANQRLESLAYFDPLTGLANRRWFYENAEKVLARCERYGSQMAVMLIDLDNFKGINDEYGHDAGDRLLISVADRLRVSIRQTDTVMHKSNEAIRLGGDEFMVLLEDVKGEVNVKFIARRIIERINQPVSFADKEFPVTGSIGVALYPTHGDSISTLLRYADIAMYRAKHKGRNQYCFFDPSVDTA